MTTLRRCSEMNTGNYGAEFRSLPYDTQNLVMAAQAAHDLLEMLDQLSAFSEDDPSDREPQMDHARDVFDAFELWQRLERRAAPILARELDHEGEAFSNTGIDALLNPENWPEFERRKARAFGEADAHGLSADAANAYSDAIAAGWDQDKAKAFADFVVRDKLEP